MSLNITLKEEFFADRETFLTWRFLVRYAKIYVCNVLKISPNFLIVQHVLKFWKVGWFR